MRGGGLSTYGDARMRDLLLVLLHLAVTAAKLCGRGGVRAIIAENLVLKQQLIVLRRGRRRASNLTPGDRLWCGLRQSRPDSKNGDRISPGDVTGVSSDASVASTAGCACQEPRTC